MKICLVIAMPNVSRSGIATSALDLELILQCKLDQPWRAGRAGDLSVRCRVRGSRRICILRMIPHVEELCAEVHRCTFTKAAHRGGFYDGHVPVVVSGATSCADRAVTKIGGRSAVVENTIRNGRGCYKYRTWFAGISRIQICIVFDAAKHGPSILIQNVPIAHSLCKLRPRCALRSIGSAIA